MPLYQPGLILEEADNDDSSDEETQNINKDLIHRESIQVAELDMSSIHRDASGDLYESAQDRKRKSRQVTQQFLSKGFSQDHGILPYASPRQGSFHTKAFAELGEDSEDIAKAVEISDVESDYLS